MTSNKRLVSLSLLVIFLAVFLALFTTFRKPNKAIVTATPDVHVVVLQKDSGVDVYLAGKDASSVSVFETTLDYDADNIQIKSAGPGGFFVQPLVVVSDIKNGRFSFAFNPGLGISRSEGISADLPVLRVGVKAKNNLGQSVTGLKPDATRVYVFDKGVFSPDISLFRE